MAKERRKERKRKWVAEIGEIMAMEMEIIGLETYNRAGYFLPSISIYKLAVKPHYNFSPFSFVFQFKS